MVRFIIIGGYARVIYEGGSTRDLDIWVDISQNHRKALDCALTVWEQRYPSHCPIGGLKLVYMRPGVQIHFPEKDTGYLDARGELVELKVDDGIDVLTSIGDMDFNECMERSLAVEISGFRTSILCQADLEQAAAFRLKNEDKMPRGK